MPTIQRNMSCFMGGHIQPNRRDIGFELGPDRGDVRREFGLDRSKIGPGGNFFAQGLIQTVGQGPRLALTHAGGLEPVDIGQLVEG